MRPEIQDFLQTFAHWRSSKPYKNTPIPDEIWDKIRELNRKFPDSQLHLHLKINSYTWSKKVLNINANKQKKNRFVEVSQPPKDIRSTSLVMQLRLPTGVEISVYQ